MEFSILYCCIITFPESLCNSFTFVLKGVRVADFHWVGPESKLGPKEYDGVLKSSHASDM